MYKLCILLFSLFTFSCNCEKKTIEQANKEMINQDFPISEIYYQSWVAGVRGGGSGINVHITFKDKLPTDVKLTKVQLLNYTTHFVDNVEGKQYIARIATEANQMKLEESPIDEYGNQAPIKKENSLKEGEVLLTFEKDGKEFTKLIENVKQVEMLAYPSTKPRN
jgi:GH18 family chitinase